MTTPSTMACQCEECQEHPAMVVYAQYLERIVLALNKMLDDGDAKGMIADLNLAANRVKQRNLNSEVAGIKCVHGPLPRSIPWFESLFASFRKTFADTESGQMR